MCIGSVDTIRHTHTIAVRNSHFSSFFSWASLSRRARALVPERGGEPSSSAESAEGHSHGVGRVGSLMVRGDAHGSAATHDCRPEGGPSVISTKQLEHRLPLLPSKQPHIAGCLFFTPLAPDEQVS